jgi:hypothetical protein
MLTVPASTWDCRSRGLTLEHPFDRRIGVWRYWPLALWLVAGWLASGTVGRAGIVYSGLKNANLPNTVDGLYVDLESGSYAESPASVPNWDINPYGTLTGQLAVWTGDVFTYVAAPSHAPSGGFGSLSVLTAGTTIDGANAFRNPGAYVMSPGAWTGVTGGYMGVRFYAELLGRDVYGWVRFNVSSGSGFPAQLVDWAYEDSGGAILAGAGEPVPEPAQMALAAAALAAGFAGLRAWRKRQGSTSPNAVRLH